MTALSPSAARSAISVTSELQQQGYAVRPAMFSAEEVAALLRTIEAAAATSPNFRRSQDVFAIRHLLHEIPALWPQLLTGVCHRRAARRPALARAAAHAAHHEPVSLEQRASQ